jgi:hypothetical protein
MEYTYFSVFIVPEFCHARENITVKDIIVQALNQIADDVIPLHAFNFI